MVACAFFPIVVDLKITNAFTSPGEEKVNVQMLELTFTLFKSAKCPVRGIVFPNLSALQEEKRKVFPH